MSEQAMDERTVVPDFGLPGERVKGTVVPPAANGTVYAESPVLTVPPIPENHGGRQLRIAELKRQREVIDREIAWLQMEMGPAGERIHTCKRCDHKWVALHNRLPSICPKCRSGHWQDPPRNGRKSLARPARLGKRHVGRPSKAEYRAELIAAKREYEAKYGPMQSEEGASVTPLNVPAIHVPSSMPGLPPPPPVSARHMPEPRLPDLEPEPVEPEPEPVEDVNAEPLERPEHEQ